MSRVKAPAMKERVAEPVNMVSRGSGEAGARGAGAWAAFLPGRTGAGSGATAAWGALGFLAIMVAMAGTVQVMPNNSQRTRMKAPTPFMIELNSVSRSGTMNRPT